MLGPPSDDNYKTRTLQWEKKGFDIRTAEFDLVVNTEGPGKQRGKNFPKASPVCVCVCVRARCSASHIVKCYLL